MNNDRLLRVDKIQCIKEYHNGLPRTTFINGENIFFGNLKCKYLHRKCFVPTGREFSLRAIRRSSDGGV